MFFQNVVSNSNCVITESRTKEIFIRFQNFFVIQRSNVGPRKIAQPFIFQTVWRSIGISFQSAIIAHRLNHICYDNATAQSYWKDFQDFILYLRNSGDACGRFNYVGWCARRRYQLFFGYCMMFWMGSQD